MTSRRISIILAALIFAVVALPAKEAMAIKGQCDPGAGNFNSETDSRGGGAVLITTVYGWDGASVFPDCVGPVQSVRVRNVSAENWYVTLPSSRRGSLSFRVAPGIDNTYTGTQLSKVGIQTNQDLAGCVWNDVQPAGTVLDLP